MKIKSILKYHLLGMRTQFSYTYKKSTQAGARNSVVSCNNHYMVYGGLSDRLQGIVSVYKMCKETGRDFKIWFDNPFELQEFLQPNKVDWRISKDEVDTSWRTKVFGAGMAYKPVFQTLEDGAEWQCKIFKRLLRRTKGRQLHIYSNAHLSFLPEFSDLFHELFVPSPMLDSAIVLCNKELGGGYVSATFRFQNLLGDFREMNIAPLSEVGQKEYMDGGLKVIDDIHQMHPDKRVLVTSDSGKFLCRAKELYPFVYTIPGKVVHMSYTDDASLKTHLKSFVDLMMVANAEKMYLPLHGKMYHSGFVRTAHMINNHPYEVIKY